MDTGDLLDLSDRASRASGPDPCLDAAICAVLRLPHPHQAMACLDDWTWTPRGTRVTAQKRGEGMTIHWKPHPVTGDEDIAAKMLPAEHEGRINIKEFLQENGRTKYMATLEIRSRTRVDDDLPTKVEGATKPLVICAAALLLLAKLNGPTSASLLRNEVAPYV